MNVDYSFINNNNDNIYLFFCFLMIIKLFYGYLYKNYYIIWRISLVYWDGEFGLWFLGIMIFRYFLFVLGFGVLMY